ncbi:MAG: hypothetical protein SH818_11910 [Saprospiraceae bacterium]|nr:hypothetical protein [Saprospiraceae bacterium]
MDSFIIRHGRYDIPLIAYFEDFRSSHRQGAHLIVVILDSKVEGVW